MKVCIYSSYHGGVTPLASLGQGDFKKFCQYGRSCVTLTNEYFIINSRIIKAQQVEV